MDLDLLRRVPDPRVWIARIIAIILFGLICALAGSAITALRMRGDVATAREKVTSCLAMNDKALTAVQRANTRLADAVRQAEQRRAAAHALVAAARTEAAPLRRRAAKVATEAPPPGVSVCEAARQAFDSELAAERRP